MTTSTITKIQNGTIVLPKTIQKLWKESEILIFPNKDTLLIKKLQKPLSRLSELAPRISSKKLNPKEIQKEIQAFRKTNK